MSRRFFVHVGLIWAALFLVACNTPKINWDSRVGNYTYDQAVIDFGPPDKSARLSDGSTVSEWLTYRGSRGTSHYYHGPFYTHPYGSMGYYDPPTPDRFLRL